MSDFTTVYFSCLDKGFRVPAILADFSIFGMHVTIHTYGAIIAFGFLLAVLLGGRIAYTWKMSLDKMIDVLIYGTIFAIIGARLYYVFSKWDYYSAHPSEIIKIWEGGLAIYGGIICGLIAAFIVCKVRKMNFYNLLDCAAIALLVGQGIGRWGNYANQEAFGINTSLPWGMYSEKTCSYLASHYSELTAHGISVEPKAPVHPTFLYESIWCLLGVLVLYIVCRKFRKFSGQMFLWYGVWYGAERAVVEGLRTDSLYIGSTNIRVSQLLSIIVAIVSLILLIILTHKYKKNPKPVDGVDFFLEDELKPKEETDEIAESENDDSSEEAPESDEKADEELPKEETPEETSETEAVENEEVSDDSSQENIEEDNTEDNTETEEVTE